MYAAICSDSCSRTGEKDTHMDEWLNQLGQSPINRKDADISRTGT